MPMTSLSAVVITLPRTSIAVPGPATWVVDDGKPSSRTAGATATVKPRIIARSFLGTLDGEIRLHRHLRRHPRSSCTLRRRRADSRGRPGFQEPDHLDLVRRDHILAEIGVDDHRPDLDLAAQDLATLHFDLGGSGDVCEARGGGGIALNIIACIAC